MPRSDYNSNSSNPATSFRSVVPSDTIDLAGGPCRALYIGTGGHVRVIGPDDDTPVTFSNVPAGTETGWGARRVLATGTTALDIVALR